MAGSGPVRAMIDPSGSGDAARLRLTAAAIGTAVLDGGWWPRSWNATIELPGLIQELSDRLGSIDRVVLSENAWDSRFRRLGTGPAAVRMVWSDDLDPALLIAYVGPRVAVHLLVVPPDSPATVAARAMDAAARRGNETAAVDLLAAARMPRRTDGGD